MSLTLSDVVADQTVEPHILCDYCRATCDSSVVIQTYTKYGNDETYADLRQRCLSTKTREYFDHCSVTDFQAGYLAGCHLCSMLFRNSMGDEATISTLIRERMEFEEKHGMSKSVLTVNCDGSNNTPGIGLCTRMSDSKLSSGFDLHGYLIRDFQDHRPSPTFPVQTSKLPTAKQAAPLFKFWLKECNQNHINCYLRYEAIQMSDMRPTRLLDVSNVNHVWLHTRGLRASRQVEYLTLSHCWPSDGKIYKLTEENMESLKRKIPLDQISQTFRDAIAITNAAGFRYLWIDSLCIIQDSPEDWMIEADRMMHVYGNASLNLVACGASGSTMFEPRNPLRYYPCRISSHECSLYVQPNFRVVEDIPAFKRGWIVQERLLSRRNIYFGMKSQLGEMTWECFEGQATETSPGVRKDNDHELARNQFIRDTEHKTIFNLLLEAVERLRENSPHHQADARLEFSRMWTKIVQIYTDTELTYSSDKVVAIAGLAKMISSKISSNYVGGMWTFTLPVSLLWSTHNYGEPDPLPERPTWRGAPSWSWASLDTEVHGHWAELLDCTTSQGLERFYARVVDCEVQLTTGRPAAFDAYASVKLRIISVLRPIREIVPYEYHDQSDGSKEFGLSIAQSLLYMPDVNVPADTPLFYFMIFRGWAMNSYDMFKWYKEEGLVLITHLDGYVRVGYMRILFLKEETETIFKDFLWGDGKLEGINIY